MGMMAVVTRDVAVHGDRIEPRLRLSVTTAALPDAVFVLDAELVTSEAIGRAGEHVLRGLR